MACPWVSTRSSLKEAREGGRREEERGRRKRRKEGKGVEKEPVH